MFSKSMFAGVALLGILTAPAIATELVTNGGFETGNLSGWTISGNTSNVGVDSSFPHTGSYEFYAGPVGSTATLSQSMAMVVGDTYSVSWNLKLTGYNLMNPLIFRWPHKRQRRQGFRAA